MFKGSCNYKISFTLVLLTLVPLINLYPQNLEKQLLRNINHGRYIPELFRADLGKWIPDDSGVYHHIKVPYNGGYGDRGLTYEHDANGKPLLNYNLPAEFWKPFGSVFEGLGPKDHLRFSLDFNYNGTGWQIVQFHWTRDGQNDQYNYVKEYKLWDDSVLNNDYNDAKPDIENAENNEASISKAELTEITDDDSMSQNVHITGVYGSEGYNYSYEDNKQTATQNEDERDVQNVIREVLNYVQSNILPTLD